MGRGTQSSSTTTLSREAYGVRPACPSSYTLSIPKGLSPSAQGCEERTTLGVKSGRRANPERVAASPFRRSGWNRATTLSTLARGSGLFPRVARSSQPWALGRNPFGIPPRVPDSKGVCKEPRPAGAFERIPITCNRQSQQAGHTPIRFAPACSVNF